VSGEDFFATFLLHFQFYRLLAKRHKMTWFYGHCIVMSLEDAVTHPPPPPNYYLRAWFGFEVDGFAKIVG